MTGGRDNLGPLGPDGHVDVDNPAHMAFIDQQVSTGMGNLDRYALQLCAIVNHPDAQDLSHLRHRAMALLIKHLHSNDDLDSAHGAREMVAIAALYIMDLQHALDDARGHRGHSDAVHRNPTTDLPPVNP